MIRSVVSDLELEARLRGRGDARIERVAITRTTGRLIARVVNDDRVITVAAIHGIGPGVAIEVVVAITAIQGVLVIATVEGVVAGSANDVIIARSADQVVVRSATVDGVLAIIAVNGVCADAAEEV